ncbi:MAG: transcription-repair coupling factor [Rickettsiales bacterium]|nr:transcription-repair coupling factor [Rickettsiales bacterium]
MKEYIVAQKQENPNVKVIISLLSESFKDRFEKIMLDYEINFPTTILPLDIGFYSSDLMIIGEQAIFGEKIVRKKNKKIASQRLLEEGLSINPGELVVHRDYGIGKFEGIGLINVGEIKVDMIKLIYGGNDTLFVPVDDINLITRYGADNPLIQLDKLGVAGWKNRREKVKKKIKVAAEELLKIAAARKVRKAAIFIPNQDFYEEFKNRFKFVETDDQLQAIEEIEEDLAKGSPMDRLICGDVGFGKTEVAMRAAAMVVGQEKIKYQVAIIAPTTLLVRQHYKNFLERFKDLNITIKQLSRLITPAKSRDIKTELGEGKVDIIIGTHALLQKTVKFKNLGLVIVDEEQHFGVAQKERLKELRNEVHLLTLSATPIPRTLQMSLTGVKDLSLIATPPIDRLAVRNFVMPYDSTITKEAVMREYNRGGRVFFVVPRIRDLEEIEPKLKILLPDIKIKHAHGRMTPNELDDIMNDFVDGKIDVLLSTTIIESGIDISEANTMIIYKADMFGLSQLYQLRGRVGRTKVRGYCYFMTNNQKHISSDAKKKLEVMQNLDSLGVGFNVASHDMDIRGSGNILGDEQSGHIKETGVELYQQMLLETIEKEKNKQANSKQTDLMDDIDLTTQVKLGISLLIPEDYIEDLALRMSFYKKIAAIKTTQDQDSILEEMTDRFGKVPDEVNNLMEVAKLKSQCQKLNIQKLEATKTGILIEFKNNKFKNPDKLMELIFSSNSQIKLQPNQKILFLYPNLSSHHQKLKSSFETIKELESKCL